MEMKQRKQIIRTKNKEVYEKLNMLRFLPEIILTTTPRNQISRIIKSINRDFELLELKNIGDYLVIKKKRPFDFEVYLT